MKAVFLAVLLFLGCATKRSDPSLEYKAKAAYYDSLQSIAKQDFVRHGKSFDSAKALNDRETALKLYVEENRDNDKIKMYNDSALLYMQKAADLTK